MPTTASNGSDCTPTLPSRPHPAAFLIHPGHVPEPKAPTSPPEVPTTGPGAPDGPIGASDDPPGPGSSLPTQFYAQFHLDRVRCIQQLGEIADHVSSKLGSDVELVLEVRAKNDEGFDESTRRTVSENARSLGAKSSEFE